MLVVLCGLAAACHGTVARGAADPALTALREPYRSVSSERFSDGGSIGIRIQDAAGNSAFFFVDATLNEPNPYSRVFVNGTSETPGARLAADPVATKERLATILKQKRNRTRTDDSSIAALSGELGYALRAAVRGLFGED